MLEKSKMKKKTLIYISIVTIVVAVLCLSMSDSKNKEHQECMSNKLKVLNKPELSEYDMAYNSCIASVAKEVFSVSSIFNKIIEVCGGTYVINPNAGVCLQQLKSTNELVRKEYKEISQSCRKEVFGEDVNFKESNAQEKQ